MSNAMLKEQIEAAKIALVHSAEQMPAVDAEQHQSAIANNNNANDLAKVADYSAPVSSLSKDGYEILEARLQELEVQIKNQQRDLHTLLQKLRDVTAKRNGRAEPTKKKITTKRMFVLLVL